MDNLPSIQELISQLKDPESLVRKSAIEALGQFDSAKALPALIEHLPQENNKEIFFKSLVVTIASYGEKAVLPLIQLLDDEEKYLPAAYILMRIPDERSIIPLIKMLSDKRMTARVTAFFALKQIGAVALVPLIEALNKSKDSMTRYFVVEALGEINDKRATEAIIGVLNDSDFNVKGKAAWVVGKFGTKETIRYLLLLLQDTDPNVVRGAEHSINNINQNN